MRFDFYVGTRAILYILMTTSRSLSAGEIANFLPITRQTVQRSLDYLQVIGYVDYEEVIWRAKQGIKARRYYVRKERNTRHNLRVAIDTIIACDLKKWQHFSDTVRIVHCDDIPF